MIDICYFTLVGGIASLCGIISMSNQYGLGLALSLLIGVANILVYLITKGG